MIRHILLFIRRHHRDSDRIQCGQKQDYQRGQPFDWQELVEKAIEAIDEFFRRQWDRILIFTGKQKPDKRRR
ncbi:hypothetical protein [Photobacterium sp. J15]|uniref:hypothetical protein n=1 Tax=Photobacterium sp. J15 TaxID=265901 RepID=UPI0007E32FAD|nr:hypothetical protein [Photobacterium sp. J15]